MSQRKLEPNRRNAQLSTGPGNTTATRLNALKHGILSEEALITVGEGQEDIEMFRQLSTALREDLAPVGALEELLVDQLIMLVWRWKRVLKYELGVIRKESDTVTDDWERKQAKEHDLYIPILHSREDWEPTTALAHQVEELEKDLQALNYDDPLSVRPQIWQHVFSVASEGFHVCVEKVLGLREHWEESPGYSPEQVRQVIDSVNKSAKVSEDQFWKRVKEMVRQEYERVNASYQRRLWTLEQVRLSASLPADTDLVKVQRYEAHLSRQFYKALHELQRLQAARGGIPTLGPLALDIDINTPDSEGYK
jgi:hypothetical protein